MMPKHQESYADNMRKRLIIACQAYRNDLIELLAECSPGHPMEGGIMAAIAETERTIRNVQQGAE